MRIHKFRDRNLTEDFIDIHYREENAQIRGLFSYLESMTAIMGKNEQGEKLITVCSSFWTPFTDRGWSGSANPCASMCFLFPAFRRILICGQS